MFYLENYVNILVICIDCSNINYGFVDKVCVGEIDVFICCNLFGCIDFFCNIMRICVFFKLNLI